MYIYRLRYCDELEFDNISIDDESGDDDDEKKDVKNIDLSQGVQGSMAVAIVEEIINIDDDSDVECVSSAEDTRYTEDEASIRAGGDQESNFDLDESRPIEQLEYASEDEDYGEQVAVDEPPTVFVDEEDPPYRGPIQMGPPASPEPEVTVPEMIVPVPDDTFDFMRVEIKQEVNVMSMEFDRSWARESGQEQEIINEGNIEVIDLVDSDDEAMEEQQVVPIPKESKVAVDAPQTKPVVDDDFEQAAKRRKLIPDTSMEDDKKSIPTATTSSWSPSPSVKPSPDPEPAAHLPVKSEFSVDSREAEILKTVSKLKIKYSDKSRSFLLAEDMMASNTKRKDVVPAMATVQIKPSWLKVEGQPSSQKPKIDARSRPKPVKVKIPFVEVQIKESPAFEWTASNIICEISCWNVKWLSAEVVVPPIFEPTMLKTTTEEFSSAVDYQW